MCDSTLAELSHDDANIGIREALLENNNNVFFGVEMTENPFSGFEMESNLPFEVKDSDSFYASLYDCEPTSTHIPTPPISSPPPDTKGKKTPETEDEKNEIDFSNDYQVLFISPDEEKEIRQQLATTQKVLEQSVVNVTKKRIPTKDKKRLRNKYASQVSRLKRKLAICGVLRDLKRAYKKIENLQTQLMVAKSS